MIILEGWMEEGGRSREEHGVVQTESVQKEVHQDDYPPQVRPHSGLLRDRRKGRMLG